MFGGGIVMAHVCDLSIHGEFDFGSTNVSAGFHVANRADNSNIQTWLIRLIPHCLSSEEACLRWMENRILKHDSRHGNGLQSHSRSCLDIRHTGTSRRSILIVFIHFGGTGVNVLFGVVQMKCPIAFHNRDSL